jgi:hypothetical protein
MRTGSCDGWTNFGRTIGGGCSLGPRPQNRRRQLSREGTVNVLSIPTSSGFGTSATQA